MHRTVSDFDGFARNWDGPLNFRISAEMIDFDWTPPPLDQAIEELRRDEMVVLRSGTPGDRLNLNPVPIEAFRAMPIETVMETPFSIAHFDLARFDAPGRCLDGFGAQVLEPWRAALGSAGFTMDRCYPIAFLSGRGCATNYHMDLSHVLAWQIHGVKRFCGLRDPDRWADKETRLTYDPRVFARPEAIRAEDALCYEMRPGDRLWNALLTPHWVEAVDGVAMSFNISHGGLRNDGRLSRNEAELEAYRARHPDLAPARIGKVYR